MDFHMKLPRNGKEMALFILVISVISVNILAPLITFLEVGFSWEVWLGCLPVIPVIWLCVVALVLLTSRPAGRLAARLTEEGDSFRVRMVMDALCGVLLMSVFMTVLGTWIGQRAITAEPLKNFFNLWPRNFAVSFAVEALIAQPIARYVMRRLHESTDGRSSAEQPS